MQSSLANRSCNSLAEITLRAVPAPEPDEDFGLSEHLRKLLTGSLDISGFRQWFANAIWSIESEADERTVDFASLVENRIAEFARGTVPDDIFIAALREDLAEYSGEPAVYALSLDFIGATHGEVTIRWDPVRANGRFVGEFASASAH